jgi:hypothetical protein
MEEIDQKKIKNVSTGCIHLILSFLKNNKNNNINTLQALKKELFDNAEEKLKQKMN